MDDITTDPRGSKPPSGRFLLRMDPGLHAALRSAALAEGISLNQHCARRLAYSAGAGEGAATEAVTLAASLVGEALRGVVLFGSWARDELTEDSDVDLLIIVDDQVTIDRALYRRWDETPLSWKEHPVEPHFVHLPDAEARVSGLWAEVATDGVVLFERNLAVSRYLVSVRQRIVSGKMERHLAHGQSYWVEVA